MASQFFLPRPQPLTATPSVYAGGKIYFYAASSSTPQNTYSDEALTVANANPVVLNSAGYPDGAIFLQNLPYKVTLKDSNDNTIWSQDPYSVTDFRSVPILKVGSGDPNGVVAGTAGTGTSPPVLPTLYWSTTTAILYVCTTTGVAASAVWTAINASAATPTVTPPQGYLTLTSATPIIAGDVSAATSVYYTPFTGTLIPVYNGSRHVPTEFTELTLSMVASHAASTLYDVFVFSNAGVLTLVTGPAWSVSTAGSGARGTGAGTTELTRLNGYWVNNVSMTGRNGSTTYSIDAQRATYVGSIFMDGSNGQISCHRTWGASRKWGVWNAYNRQPLYLKAGDSTASWNYTTNTIRASNNASTNSLTVFAGLPEEWFNLSFDQSITITHADTNATEGRNGIGWNSTTAASGRTGRVGGGGGGQDAGDTLLGNARASFLQVPTIGINVVTALETAPSTGNTVTWLGGEDDMVLAAYWRG
jgi:hypothetical protein